MTFRKISTFFILFAFMGLLCFAQLDRGTLTGRAVDSSGATIPGTKITIRNANNGVTYKTEANGNGEYTMPTLPAGSYRVTFEANGFKTLTQENVVIRPTDVIRVDGLLQVGNTSDTVLVTAPVSRIQTETPEVSTEYTGKDLLKMNAPLTYGGRNPDNLAPSIIPGVSGTSWNMRINGSTSYSKETLLDGASTSAYLSGQFGESAPSMEALEEVKVQVSGLSAEYGRTQGAVFNYTTKSGTNQIHGSAFGSLQNEVFNANGFANNSKGAKRQPDRIFDYAGSFGGPVFIPKVFDGRNKLFFYFAAERYQQNDTVIGSPDTTVPLPEFYQGDFSRLLGPVTNFTDALGRNVPQGAIYDPSTFRQLPNGQWVGDMFPGNRIPASRFSGVSQTFNQIASADYPAMLKGADGQYLLQNNAYSLVNGQPYTAQNNISLKMDYNINDAHKLSGLWSFNGRPRSVSDGFWNPTAPNGGVLSSTYFENEKSYTPRLSETWIISPASVNIITVSLNRMINPTYPIADETNGAQQMGIPNLNTVGWPVINWGGGPYIGLENPGEKKIYYQVYQGEGLTDTISFSRGRHFLKAGFDMRRNHEDTSPGQQIQINFSPLATSIPNAPFAGNYTGYAFASYLLGGVGSVSMNDPVGIGDRLSYYALYLQDDFKVNSRLTLNLGLRWEFQPPETEVANRLSSFDPNKIDPATGLKGAYAFAGSCSVCTGKNYFGTKNYHNFGPRFGFAYRVSDKWSIRGAYGILYEADLFDFYNGTGTPLSKLTSIAWGGTYNYNPDQSQPWAPIFNWDNGFPANRYIPASYDVSYADKSGSGAGMIDPRYGLSPYIQQWNFNIQRQLARRTVLDVGYLGNKATRLRNGTINNINQIPTSLLATYAPILNNPVTNAAQAAANGVAYPYPGFSGTVGTALRPFPQVYGGINVYGSPIGFSTYNSLQVQLNRQVSNGLSLQASWVWSKTLTNTNSSMPSDNSSPLDQYNWALEKQLASSDVPHEVKISFFYDLPFGRGQAIWANAPSLVNHLIGGWNISGVLNYISGTPLGFSSNGIPGFNNGSNRDNVEAGDLKQSGFDKSAFDLTNLSDSSNTYINKSMFSQPAPYTLGTGAKSYGQLRGFGTTSENIVIRKTLLAKERYQWLLRAEMVNAFNRSTLGSIQTNVNNSLFGQVTGINGARQVQLVTRFEF